MRQALDETIDRAKGDVRRHALDLQAGRINLPEWQLRMERSIKTIHVMSAAAAAGGWAQATAADWGTAANKIKRQYRWLERFARQLQDGLPLDGRFLVRAQSYASSGSGTYEAVLRRRDLASGNCLKERRIVHSGHPCASCVEYAAMGWQEPGTLPDVGEECECGTRCQCSFERQFETPARPAPAIARPAVTAPQSSKPPAPPIAARPRPTRPEPPVPPEPLPQPMFPPRPAPPVVLPPLPKPAPVPPAAPKPAPVAPPKPPAPTFGRSKATVKIRPDFGDEGATVEQRLRHASTILGRPVTAEDLASLVGAPDNATVMVGMTATDWMEITFHGPGYNGIRRLLKDRDGNPTLENVLFSVDDKGKGLGRQVFGRQIENAAAMGVSSIRTTAAGRPGDSLNGYYTWPRFGYDAPIPQTVANKLPAKFRGATRVSDLMTTEERRDWWKAHGKTVDATFDLREGSLSRRIWDGYLTEKADGR